MQHFASHNDVNLEVQERRQVQIYNSSSNQMDQGVDDGADDDQDAGEDKVKVIEDDISGNANNQ